MKFKISYIIIMMLFLTANVFYVSGQDYEKNISVTKSFNIDTDTEVQISNKYGNIHIIPWEKDSVLFTIKLTVKANKESKADKLLDNVDFDFTATRYYIIAQTTFGRTTFFSDLANTMFSGGNNTQIDYYVNLPSYCPVKIDNKFGNVYFTDYNGEIDITISNGDFKAHDLYGASGIKVEFGNIFVNSLDNGELSLNYGELELKRSNEISVFSKSSRLEIEKVHLLDITSRRDKFYIDTADILDGELSFSFLEVKNMNWETKLSNNYGSVDLEIINNGFKGIDMNGEYTDISLGFVNPGEYSFEITHSSKTSLDLPYEQLNIEELLIDKSINKYKTFSKSIKVNTPSIILKTNGGSVQIKHK